METKDLIDESRVKQKTLYYGITGVEPDISEVLEIYEEKYNVELDKESDEIRNELVNAIEADVVSLYDNSFIDKVIESNKVESNKVESLGEVIIGDGNTAASFLSVFEAALELIPENDDSFILATPLSLSFLQTCIGEHVYSPALEGTFKGPNNSQFVGTIDDKYKVFSFLLTKKIYKKIKNNETINIIGYKKENGDIVTRPFSFIVK